MSDPPLCLMILLYNEAHFIKVDWSEYYPNTAEPIPVKMPRTLWKSCYDYVLLMPIMLDAVLCNDHKLVFLR